MEDTIATIYTSSMGDESTNLDYISKWRWALAQVAQYCIDNRLRTPLGKPADTFLKLESKYHLHIFLNLFIYYCNNGFIPVRIICQPWHLK